MDPNKTHRAVFVLLCILVAIQIIKIAVPITVWFQQRFIDQGSSQRWSK